MQTSEQINELAAALAKAQGAMGGAVKDSSNPFFKSKSAYLLLKNGFEESFTAPPIAPCAFASAAASSLICSLVCISVPHARLVGALQKTVDVCLARRAHGFPRPHAKGDGSLHAR